MSTPGDGRGARVAAALLGGIAVALGAFGAHGLEERLDAEALDWWDLGVRYQFWHAIALWLAGETIRASGRGRGAAVAFGTGIALFSGSLYALALTGARSLGAVTPFGGAAFLVGWGLLVAAVARGREPGSGAAP